MDIVRSNLCVIVSMKHEELSTVKIDVLSESFAWNVENVLCVSVCVSKCESLRRKKGH
jgi:hypothetical protein